MKKILNNIKELYKKIYKKFIATNICVILLSIFAVLGLENVRFTSLMQKIVLFLITFAISSFFIESKQKQSIKSYLIASIISILTIVIIYIPNYTTYMQMVMARWIIVIYLSLLFIALISNYKNSAKSLSKYCLSVTENLFLASIAYSVVTTGILLIMLLIDVLLINDFATHIIPVITLVSAIGYYPVLLYTLVDIKEPNQFTKTLISKIIYLICLVAYLSIYIYIFKITLTGQTPKNCIFAIITAAFIITSITSLLVRDNTENKVLIKINKVLPYIFIPMLVIQSYSLMLRIRQYGLTTVRYIGIIVIMFEIIYIILKSIKVKDEIVLYAIVTVVLVFNLVPIINIYDLPFETQKIELLKYKNSGVVDNKIYSAYTYINDNDYERNIIKKHFKPAELETLENKITEYEEKLYKENIANEDDYYVYGYYDGIINVAGYNQLEEFGLNVTEIKDLYDIDVTEIINEYIANADDIYEYMKNHNELTFEDKKLIITSVDIHYGYKNYLDDCSLSGYILTK